MTRYLEIKPGSISEVAKKLREDYEAYFKKELEKEGKPITSMTDAEKKAFFNRVDKGWNAKNEQDDIQKAPNRHSVMKGKLLLEPKKDDMKDQPKMQQEATSSIISQDLEKSVEDEAVDKNHMLVVNPKNKKPGVDGVKKIHKSEWPKHQKQGYIQAEAVKDHKEPDADNMGGPSDHDADNKKKSSKEEELTAAQKKLPPALQKAIDKKEKNEEVKLQENKDVFHKGKKVGYVVKEGGKFTAYYDYDDPKDPQPGETNESKEGFNTEQEAIQYIKSIQEEVELQEATPLQTSITMMKTLAAKAGIKPATSNNGYQAIYDYKNGEGSFKGQGKKSYEQVKNWIYKNGYIVQTDYLKQIMGEEVELDEAGMKEIDTEKQEIERLRTRLTQLRDAEKASAGGDTTNLEKQINQTRLSLLDLQKRSLERKEKQEDVDADKMNKKQKDVKGEKEPIKKIEEAAKKVDVKKDKKGSKDVNVQIEVESKKPNYKNYKKSLKKEEETPKNMKKTLTGQPVTKIDVEPKLAGHN